LLYQGIANFGRGSEGYGLFIAQAAQRWNLQTCRVVSPQRERALENVDKP
jgi:hypothetical protein